MSEVMLHLENHSLHIKKNIAHSLHPGPNQIDLHRIYIINIIREPPKPSRKSPKN